MEVARRDVKLWEVSLGDDLANFVCLIRNNSRLQKTFKMVSSIICNVHGVDWKHFLHCRLVYYSHRLVKLKLYYRLWVRLIKTQNRFSK